MIGAISLLWAPLLLADLPPPLRPARPFEYPAPEVLALSDGTPVWLVQRHDLPLVRVELSLGAGWLGAPDPEAAQLVGKLLGDWERWLPDLERELDGLGAALDIGVGASRSWLDLESLPASLEPALQTAWGAFLTELAPPRRSARAAREEWLALERSAGLAPELVRRRALAAAVYPAGHPLRAVPDLEHLKALAGVDLAAAWRRVREDGAPSLVVVGDTNAAEILPILESALPSLPGRSHPQALAAPPERARLILVSDAGASRAQISGSWPAPEAFSEALIAAELVAEIAGGGFTSRLNARLREELGLTYEVSTSIQAWAGHGRLNVDLSVDRDKCAIALSEVETVLATLAEQGPTEAELRGAVARLSRQRSSSAGTLRGLAFELGVDLAYQQPPAWPQTHLAVLSRLQVAELQQAAQLFKLPHSWVISGDIDVLDEIMSDAGRAPDAIWSAEAVARGRVQ